MPGLLDLVDDPNQIGLLSLGLRLMSAPGKFSTGFGQAGLGALGDIQAAREAMDKRKLQAAQQQLIQAQVGDMGEQAKLRAAQARELERRLQQQAAFNQELTQTLGSRVAPIDANAATGITGPRPQALAAVGQARPVDYQSLMMRYPDLHEQIKNVAAAADLGKPEVARTIETMGPSGPMTQQYDKFGQAVGGAVAKPVELKTVDTGDRVQSYNPYTGKNADATWAKGQSPDSKASNALGYARLNFDMAKPEFHDGQFVYRPTAAAPNGVVVQPAGLNNAKGADELRKEFAGLPEVKNFKEVAPVYTAMLDASQRNTPQADINLVYGLAKIFDPGSVVREGEYATIDKSQTIPDWLKGQAQRLAGGARLTDETRQKLLEEAGGRVSSFKGQYDSARANFEGIAKKRLIDPQQVFTDVALPEVKFVKLDGGGSVAAKRGADGNYYVQRGGKTYRVEE